MRRVLKEAWFDPSCRCPCSAKDLWSSLEVVLCWVLEEVLEMMCPKA